MAAAASKSPPTFGANRAASKRVPFKLAAYRSDDEQVTFDFNARPRATSVEMLNLIKATSDSDGDGGVGEIMRLMTKIMDNKDGVPDGWKPTQLEITDVPEPEVGKRVPSYRGPDGVIYPLSDEEKLAGFLKLEAGSSKRRWKYLMFEDDELLVEAETIIEAANYLISEAADRPTRPRS